MQKKAKLVLNILIMVFLAIVIQLFPKNAIATGSLGVSAKLTPNEFERAQKAEIIIELTNNTLSIIDDVKLSVGNEVDRYLGAIEPNQTRSFKISNLFIEEHQIGENLDFSLSFVEEGSVQTASSSVKVARKASKPQLAASRQATKKAGAIGDNVTITYNIENTGDVDLSNVKISESLSDAPVISGLSLPAGSGRKTFEFSFVLKEKTKSSSRATASAPDGSNVNIDLNSINFDIVDAKLELSVLQSLNQENAQKDTISMDVSVKNVGNVGVKNIILTDELGANIDEEFSLNAGEEKTIVHKVSILQDRAFSVGLAGKLSNDEKSDYEITSNIVELKKELSAQDVAIEIFASTTSQELSKEGEVPFKIKINNPLSFELTNFVIFSANDESKLLYNLATVPSGETTIDINAFAEQTQEFVFKAKYQDVGGATFEALSNPVTVTIAPIVEQQTQKPTPAKEVWVTPSGDLIALFVGILVLIGGSIFGISYISKIQKREVKTDNSFDNKIQGSDSQNIKEKKAIEKIKKQRIEKQKKETQQREKQGLALKQKQEAKTRQDLLIKQKQEQEAKTRQDLLIKQKQEQEAKTRQDILIKQKQEQEAKTRQELLIKQKQESPVNLVSQTSVETQKPMVPAQKIVIQNEKRVEIAAREKPQQPPIKEIKEQKDVVQKTKTDDELFESAFLD